MTMRLVAGLNQATSTSISRTYSTHAGDTPDAGEILIAILSTGAAATDVTTNPPAGWTLGEVLAVGTGNLSAAWYWKISDGTEDVVTWTWTTGTTATLVIAAFTIGNTLDDSNDDETNKSAATTSCASGNATASAAAGYAIAIFTADSGRNVDAGAAYSDSFLMDATHGIQSFAAAADRGGVFMASKSFTGTGTHSCTFSCSDTGDEMYGSIALFITAGGVVVGDGLTEGRGLSRMKLAA